MKALTFRLPKRTPLLALLACCLLLAAMLFHFHPSILPTSSQPEEGVKLPVLMYHHMLRQSKLLGDYCITPQEFEGDLLYLKEHGYQSITTSQLIDYCENGTPLPEKPVLITFDDGYESSYVYAYPILKEQGMTACISLIGYYSDLYTQVDDSHVNYSHMTWSQVNEVYKSGVFEIGNHTYNLHSLDKGRKGCRIRSGENPEEYREMLLEDLTSAQEQIAKHTGSYPQVFAYPYGAICNEAKEVVEELGFPVVFTCEEKVNNLTGDPEELKHLGRFNRPHGINREEFFARVLK
ncbi:MAG: polysaccharide deacetylase family protein [Oscillospiraceae bacterium]|jgi:peptidoglycan/xylan/chitin deacetylase (PgdA/CDA1 family)|nr:polysaccharide deacetylase family protein [Oscillospiraceae bacterium]